MPNLKLINASGQSTTYNDIDTLCMTKDDGNKAFYAFSYQQFTVTNNLAEHSSTDNTATLVNSNADYVANLSADSGYKISNITVTINGVDVSSSVVSSNKITISSSLYTGPIVITTTTEESHGYNVTFVYNGTGAGYTAYKINGGSWTSMTGGTTSLTEVNTLQIAVHTSYLSYWNVNNISDDNNVTYLDYNNVSSYSTEDNITFKYSSGSGYISDAVELTKDITVTGTDGPWCIEENETIELYDGSTKLAKDIIEGDVLLGANGLQSTVVSNIYISNRTDCYKLTLSNDDTLIITSEHNQLMNDLSTKKVVDLVIGDIVYTDLAITNIEKLEESYNVCDIDVDNDDTFRIRGNLYTHNGYPS